MVRLFRRTTPPYEAGSFLMDDVREFERKYPPPMSAERKAALDETIRQNRERNKENRRTMWRLMFSPKELFWVGLWIGGLTGFVAAALLLN